MTESPFTDGMVRDQSLGAGSPSGELLLAMGLDASIEGQLVSINRTLSVRRMRLRGNGLRTTVKARPQKRQTLPLMLASHILMCDLYVCRELAVIDFQ
jgi:hypothetical protein